MRLEYVEFKRLEKFGNASTNAIQDETFGEMVWKPAEGVVLVGKEVFPLASIHRMRGVNKEEICPECSGLFQDARGLGAHRKLKHDIAGARAR